MSDVMEPQRRQRGRPQVRSDEATRHLIAEAARGVFIACGYSAANMDCVAKNAAVSKKTLYRLFPTKAELFRASIADRIDSFILALDEERGARVPPERALVRILTEYGRMALAEDTTAIQKLVLAESDRFPALAADFYRGAVIATQRVFVRCLERLCREGAIEIGPQRNGGHAPRHDDFRTFPGRDVRSKGAARRRRDRKPRNALCATVSGRLPQRPRRVGVVVPTMRRGRRNVRERAPLARFSSRTLDTPRRRIIFSTCKFPITRRPGRDLEARQCAPPAPQPEGRHDEKDSRASACGGSDP